MQNHDAISGSSTLTRAVEATTELVGQFKMRGYELLELLGQGGFGSVYRALQLSTGQAVAIKCLKIGGIPEEKDRKKKNERFKREIRLCTDLNHPHIVKLLDKGNIPESRLYAVFEFIPGKTLRDIILQKGTLSAAEAGEYMAQTLDALSCAHARGIVHRDLKPQNIMVTETGARPCVKVLDFGIGALVPHARKTDYHTLTDGIEAIGTPSYSAPEQLRGDPPTIKSDLYSWGLIFLECLTGNPVMKGETLAEICYGHLSPLEIPLPPAIAGHELGNLLRRVLKKNPWERTGDAIQVFSDLLKINLNLLVGNLNTTAVRNASAAEETRLNTSFWKGVQSERRQITVICCHLGIGTFKNSKPDFEFIETIRKDRLQYCKDICLRYGGYATGAMGSYLMFHFGYPYKNDSDARLAAKAALELTCDVRRRNIFLKDLYGINLELRVGIHTGMALIREKEPPAGIAPDIALRLTSFAPPQSILVSGTTRELLRQYTEFEATDLEPLKIGDNDLKIYCLTDSKEAEAGAITFPEQVRTGIPMVGRQTEFRRILRLFEETIEGGKRCLLISGEPGIGKSRLAHEMQMKIAQRGYATKTCRCLPEYANNALYPILEIIKKDLKINNAPPHSRVIERMERELRECNCAPEVALPILCSWMFVPQPGDFQIIQHSPARQKEILFDVLERILANGRKEGPWVLVVEDLHWCDATTLELLDRFVKREMEKNAFIIMTARPEFANPWDEASVSAVVLDSLAVSEVEAMIAQITGEKPVEKRTLARLAQRTDGIPFYIEELTRMLLDNSSLTENNGVMTLKENALPEAMPVTLRSLLETRLNGLGQEKETLQIASVIGREFEFSLLSNTSEKDDAVVRSELDKLLSANLIYRHHKAKKGTFVFRHALIRDAAYDSMLASVKKSTHRRIGEIYEKSVFHLAEEKPSELARHFGLACEYEKAVHYGIEAAKAAVQRSLNDDTIVYCRQALEWIESLRAEKQRNAELTVNMYLTQALMSKYGWADVRAKECADRSLLLLGNVKNDMETVPFLWSLATYHHVAGNRRDVRVLADQLNGIAEQAGDPGLKVAGGTLMGLRCQADGEYRKAAEALEYAIKLHDSERDGAHSTIFGFDTRVWSEATLGVVYCFTEKENGKADTACTNAIDRGRELQHVPSLCMALLYYGLVSYHQGNKLKASELMSELLELAERFGLPAYTGYGSIIHCWAKGEPEMIRNILDGLRRLGCKLGLTLYTAMLADALADKGAVKEAVLVVDACIDFCGQNDEHGHEAALYLQHARYDRMVFPERSESVRTLLLKAARLAKMQGACRLEAEAMRELATLKGGTGRAHVNQTKSDNGISVASIA